MKLHIITLLAAFGVTYIHAQSVTDFETPATSPARYAVYDSWASSPFRSGTLKGNIAIAANPDKSGINASSAALAIQRSRYASNVFGARIWLSSPLRLTPKPRKVSVMIFTPVAGRTMLIGIGKRADRPAQKLIEQFNVLSDSISPGKWQKVDFAVSGADGVEIESLVVVPHCESPHTLNADFAAYIDNVKIE